MSDEKEVVVKFKRTLPNAVIPTKAHPDDEGYDLTIVKLDKVIGMNTVRFDTGIAVQPPHGYHTRIVARSSLTKTGYMVTNNVGIIDRSYTGNLLVCVTHVDLIDKFILEASLPFKGFQLLVEKSIPSKLVEVDELVSTERGSGGFGSSDKIGSDKEIYYHHA